MDAISIVTLYTNYTVNQLSNALDECPCGVLLFLVLKTMHTHNAVVM